MNISDDEAMQRALALAHTAQTLGEVPVGAVVVHQGVIVGEGYNRREIDHDPLAHAELIAIKSAAQQLQRWRLIDCTLFVTLEPCFMCAGAIVNARVPRLVYGTTDKKAGAVHSLAQVCTDARLNHRVDVVGGVCVDACQAQLTAFFRALRLRQKRTASATVDDKEPS